MCRGNGMVLGCAKQDEKLSPAPSFTVPTEYVVSRVCGSAQAANDPNPAVAEIDCWGYQILCRQPGATRTGVIPRVTVSYVYSIRTGTRLRTEGTCGVTPAPAAALPALARVRDEVTRYAPPPITLTGGTDYLLNAAVVFTATGARGQDLTDVQITFSLAGQALTAALHLTKTVWTWGDGTTDTITTGDLTGHPYTDADPCETPRRCSHYIAHTYTRPGTTTVTVDAYWAATVTIDATGTTIPVTGGVHRTDTTGKTITIHRAHAILVNDR